MHDAERWAHNASRGHRLESEGFFALSEEERRDVSANIPLLRVHVISISEAVSFAIKRLRPAGRTKPLEEVIEELILSKAQRFSRGDLREQVIATSGSALNRLPQLILSG